jgi:hypothetical protein
MTLETERRKENRKRPPSLVYVELASANGGMMRDICEEGFAVRAMMPLRIGDSTPFAFSVDASTRFEGFCRVLWVEEGGRVAGLKFTEISPQLLEQVRMWLSEEGPPPANQSPPPAVPARQLSTFEELRDELRGLNPRVEESTVESAPVEESTVESAPVEESTVESAPVEESTVESAPVQTSAAETLRGETPLVENPLTGISPVEILQVEIPRMKLPRTEEPNLQVRDKKVSPIKEAIVRPRSQEHEETAPQFLEQEGELKPERCTFPESVLAPPTELTSELPGFEPLPELQEELGVAGTHGSAIVLDRTTVFLAIRILVFLALVAAAVVYHRELGSGLIWLGARMSGAQTTSGRQHGPTNAAPVQTATPSTSSPVSRAAVTTPNPSQAAAKDGWYSAPSTPEVKKPNETTLAAGNPSAKASKSTKPDAPTSVPATSRPSGQKPLGEPKSEAGHQEYLQAQDILKSKNRGSGLPEAVRLLWIAVEKGNSAAEVSLAELYWRGEGVTKNCDQTQILLTAAARKGNPDAQKRLGRFLQGGCE